MDIQKKNGRWKMKQKKYLDKKIGLTATCVRVPVKTSHSESANVEFENEYDLETVREILMKSSRLQSY